MDTAKLKQAIICDIARRGDGVKTPIRAVTQVFTIDGALIAESDPLNYSIEKINEIIGNLPCDATLSDFKSRLLTN